MYARTESPQHQRRLAFGRGDLVTPPGMDYREGKTTTKCVNQFQTFLLSELVCTTLAILGGVETGAGPEPAVHRVVTPGKPQFQLRKGEEGLSVFDASKVTPEQVVPHFREGSGVTTKTVGEIESHGLKVEQTPGHPDLPQHLKDAHMEIRKSESMTRDQFKQAIKKLEPK